MPYSQNNEEDIKKYEGSKAEREKLLKEKLAGRLGTKLDVLTENYLEEIKKDKKRLEQLLGKEIIGYCVVWYVHLSERT